MLCSNPIERSSNINGKDINRKTSKMLFPCGQCLNCRINKAHHWTDRILLESLQHANSSFVTLTYNNFFLPYPHIINGSLFPKDLTLFFKRLRSNTGRKFRYYACGEYGGIDERPHYHIALFGYSQLEGKEKIQDAWSYKGYPIGIVDVGELNSFSARYIAGYVSKKLGWDKDDERMVSIELRGRKKQYHVMSRMPALGSESIKKFSKKTGGKKYIKVVQNGREIYLGKTLKSLMMKEQGIGEDYNDFSKYTNELYDLVERGTPFREGVLNAFQGKRNRKQKIYHFFKNRKDKL